MTADIVDVFAYDCAFCWDSGTVMVEEMDRNGDTSAVPRPCPEGCLTPDEVPY